MTTVIFSHTYYPENEINKSIKVGHVKLDNNDLVSFSRKIYPDIFFVNNCDNCGDILVVRTMQGNFMGLKNVWNIHPKNIEHVDLKAEDFFLCINGSCVEYISSFYIIDDK